MPLWSKNTYESPPSTIAFTTWSYLSIGMYCIFRHLLGLLALWMVLLKEVSWFWWILDVIKKSTYSYCGSMHEGANFEINPMSSPPWDSAGTSGLGYCSLRPQGAGAGTSGLGYCSLHPQGAGAGTSGLGYCFLFPQGTDAGTSGLVVYNLLYWKLVQETDDLGKLLKQSWWF